MLLRRTRKNSAINRQNRQMHPTTAHRAADDDTTPGRNCWDCRQSSGDSAASCLTRSDPAASDTSGLTNFSDRNRPTIQAWSSLGFSCPRSSPFPVSLSLAVCSLVQRLGPARRRSDPPLRRRPAHRFPSLITPTSRGASALYPPPLRVPTSRSRPACASPRPAPARTATWPPLALCCRGDNTVVVVVGGGGGGVAAPHIQAIRCFHRPPSPTQAPRPADHPVAATRT